MFDGLSIIALGGILILLIIAIILIKKFGFKSVSIGKIITLTDGDNKKTKKKREKKVMTNNESGEFIIILAKYTKFLRNGFESREDYKVRKKRYSSEQLFNLQFDLSQELKTLNVDLTKRTLITNIVSESVKTLEFELKEIIRLNHLAEKEDHECREEFLKTKSKSLFNKFISKIDLALNDVIENRESVFKAIGKIEVRQILKEIINECIDISVEEKNTCVNLKESFIKDLKDELKRDDDKFKLITQLMVELD